MLLCLIRHLLVILTIPTLRNEGYCYGCHCNGSPDMKHPSSGYMAGHTSNVSGRSSKINCGKFDDEDNEDEVCMMIYFLSSFHSAFCCLIRWKLRRLGNDGCLG